jgi:Bacterial SH3 domain
MVIVRSMPLRKADGPLTVQLPSPGQDRPSWLGVGAVAAIGFVVGVAWPHLAGVRLGPSVPDSPAASASESEPAPGAASPPAVSPVVPVTLPTRVAPSSALAPSLASSPPASSPGAVRVSVAHGAVFSCKTASGDSLKGADCGALPGLDGLVLPRLRKLADCPDAAGTNGKVHLVVRADFARDALAVELGHDHGGPTAGPLLVCAKSALASATLDGIAHDNPRYSVAYTATFGAPAAAAATEAPPAAAPADGTAQVEWDVAIVRDAPKTTGKALARLPRGTPLRIGSSKDGWYPVKYGDGFTSDGWIYRGAIGR